MNPGSGVAIISCVLLLAAVRAASAETMECNQRLVGQGDAAALVLEYCGEPDARDGNRWIYKRPGGPSRVVVVGNDLVMFIEDYDETFSDPYPLGDQP